MTTGATIRVIVERNPDSGQPYVYQPDPAGDVTGDHLVLDIPSALWQHANRALGAYQAAIAAVLDHAGVDPDSIRLPACCDEWDGTVTPGVSWWAVVAHSDTPGGDVVLSIHRTRGAAEQAISRAPERFYLHNGRWPLDEIQRNDLAVRADSLRGDVSCCRRCGWPRIDHRHTGRGHCTPTPTDSVAAILRGLGVNPAHTTTLW